ncbi:MAG: hypothetical protein J3K34DRAFT_30282 [Monoraphidium minutum]|nr:MAG: hypothetical protein J3K34DRAFT_30282 [Monoraphidium minutum]
MISSMAKEGGLQDLLAHPGAATVGVYYLARRHEMERRAEPLDGTHVGDGALVHSLLHYVDVSDSAYPDRYSDIVERGRVLHEGDVLYHQTDAAPLQPGFYIARDAERKRILWVIAGPGGAKEALAELAGGAAPLPGGGYAHAGMWRAALWLMDSHLERVIEALAAHPGYGLTLVGHSTGAGICALVAHVLTTNPELGAKLGGAGVEAFCIAPAACMSSDIAAASGGYVTSLVMRYDLVPRFSAHSVEALKAELLSVDYKSLLTEDLMAHDSVRRAVEATAAAAARIRASERAHAALGRAATTAARVAQKVAENPKVVQLEKLAQGAAGGLASKIDAALEPAGGDEPASPRPLAELAERERAAGRAPLVEDALLKVGDKVSAAAGAALQSERVRGALGWVSTILKRAAAARPGGGRDVGPEDVAGATPLEGGGVGGAKEAAGAGGGGEGEAAAVALYAPGRILWLVSRGGGKGGVLCQGGGPFTPRCACTHHLAHASRAHPVAGEPRRGGFVAPRGLLGGAASCVPHACQPRRRCTRGAGAAPAALKSRPRPRWQPRPLP